MPGPFPVPEADDASTYFQTYIRLLGGENPLEADARIHAHTLSMLEPLSEEQSQFRYAPDKWSIREWRTAATAGSGNTTLGSGAPTHALVRATASGATLRVRDGHPAERFVRR